MYAYLLLSLLTEILKLTSPLLVLIFKFIGSSNGLSLVKSTVRGNKKNPSKPPVTKHKNTAMDTYNQLKINIKLFVQRV